MEKAPIPLCDCGMAQAIEMLGDRWSLLILREVLYGVNRFDNIRDDISIPKSVLSQRLAKLVDNGILEKRAYQDPGNRKRFEYVATEAGRSFILPLLAIMQWGDTHIRKKNSSLGLIDVKTGNAVKVGLVAESGLSVPLTQLGFSLLEKVGSHPSPQENPTSGSEH